MPPANLTFSQRRQQTKLRKKQSMCSLRGKKETHAYTAKLMPQILMNRADRAGL